MDSVDILKKMAEDPQTLHEVLVGLAHGTFDEWDCGFDTAISEFGPRELAIAARSGWMYIDHLKSTPEGSLFLDYRTNIGE